MKKQIIYFGVMIAVISLTASCSSDPLKEEDNLAEYIEGDHEQEKPETDMPDTPQSAPGVVEPEKTGNFGYRGNIPDGMGKIPECGTGTPEYARFDLTGEDGKEWPIETGLNLINGLYVSEPYELPQGKYTLKATVLLNGKKEIIYALPDATDTNFLPIADTVLPIVLEIAEGDTYVEGSAMCFTSPNVIITEDFQGGMDTIDISYANLYFNTSTDGLDGCINEYTVDVFRNGNTEPQRMHSEFAEDGFWLSGWRQAPLIKQMDSIWIRSWTNYFFGEGQEERQRYTVTPDNYPSEHIGDTFWFTRSCN